MGAITSVFDDGAIEFFDDVIAEVMASTGIVPRQGHLAVPHITYLTAELDDLPKFEIKLRQVAAQNKPFKIRTTGLGIFTGATPVLYVNIVSTKALRKLQAQIWEIVGPCVQKPSPFYHPDLWMPHITLGWGGDEQAIGQALGLLSARDFSLEVTLEYVNVFFADSDDTNLRIPFAGGSH